MNEIQKAELTAKLISRLMASPELETAAAQGPEVFAASFQAAFQAAWNAEVAVIERETRVGNYLADQIITGTPLGQQLAQRILTDVADRLYA